MLTSNTLVLHELSLHDSTMAKKGPLTRPLWNFSAPLEVGDHVVDSQDLAVMVSKTHQENAAQNNESRASQNLSSHLIQR